MILFKDNKGEIMQLKTDYNSTTNQEIKSKFVQREVLMCFSYEMSQILKASLDCGHSDLPTWEDIENVYDEETDEYQEIFEWWIITEYLYDKLKEKGQPVLEWSNSYYWGRCTTGQAILLDHVISEICEDMQILEGQKYSWA